jgi:ribosomal protein L40E
MAEESKLVRVCGKCAAELPEDANFCPSCGTTVRSAESRESVGEMLVGFASGAAEEIRQTAEPVLKSETGRKVAAGAAIGAVAAVVIPFVSIGVGAVVGAGVAAYRRLGRKA